MVKQPKTADTTTGEIGPADHAEAGASSNASTRPKSDAEHGALKKPSNGPKPQRKPPVPAAKGTHPQSDPNNSPITPKKPGEPEREADATALLLAEFRSFRAEYHADQATLQQELASLRKDTTNLQKRSVDLEERVSSLDDNVIPLLESMPLIQDRLSTLEKRADDQESRARRNNIRVMGIAEGTERGPVATFMEDTLLKLFPSANFTPHFSVVRAHRALGPRPPPGARPRPIIIRLLHYLDRDKILAEARTLGSVTYGGSKVHFYPDLVPAVQKARQRFYTVKQALIKNGIKYAMLYPARLKILVNGRAHLFNTPEEAMQFAEHNIFQNGGEEEENAVVSADDDEQ